MESPFPVGKSPFHCKGVPYKNLVAFLDVQHAGGYAGFVAKLHDAALREFASQPFLDGSWYDALPMMTLLHELGLQLRMPMTQLARDLARFGTKRDMNGIYRLLLKLTSPQSLLERSTNTSRQYFDFVTSSYEKLADKRYRLTHVGIPATAASVYMSIVEGFVEAGLGLAGARDVQQVWAKPQPAGHKHDVPIVKLQRDISWR